MTQAEQKQSAIRFLENFNHPDPKVFEELVTEDFTFEIVSALKEFPPIRGRANFATAENQRRRLRSSASLFLLKSQTPKEAANYEYSP